MQGLKEIEVIISMAYEVCSHSGSAPEVCHNESHRRGVLGVITVYIKNRKTWDRSINGLLLLIIMLLVSLSRYIQNLFIFRIEYK